MDTPTITAYYRESNPLKRKKLLDMSIAQGEEAEENAIRKELWEMRYSAQIDKGSPDRADGLLAFWMLLEFNKNAEKRWGGVKRARKEAMNNLEKLHFVELMNKSPLHEELLYRECEHMVNLYVELCKTDKSYSSMLSGLINMKKESIEEKLKNDIVNVGIHLPKALGMEEEMKLFTKATKEVYQRHFPEFQSII